LTTETLDLKNITDLKNINITLTTETLNLKNITVFTYPNKS